MTVPGVVTLSRDALLGRSLGLGAQGRFSSDNDDLMICLQLLVGSELEQSDWALWAASPSDTLWSTP